MTWRVKMIDMPDDHDLLDLVRLNVYWNNPVGGE